MSEINGKIAGALGRVSQAFRVLLRNEGKANGLSPIQIQILLFLLFQPEGKSTVSALAREFDLTKATISDSVKLLLKKGLVQKDTDPADVRSYTMALTAAGKEASLQSARFAAAIERPLNRLTTNQKAILFSSLLKLIHEFHHAGIISVQRMCYTCSFYEPSGREHYCKLLESKLKTEALRLDCADYRP